MSVSISQSVRALLHCPLCPTRSLLVLPTTLRCGHTVCASHVHQDPSVVCPLPICPPALPESRISPNIPQDSTVAFHPAIIYPPPAPTDQVLSSSNHAESGADITVNKIIDILSRFDIPPDNLISTDEDESVSDATSHLLPPSPSLSNSLPPNPSFHSRSHSRPSTGSDSSHTSTRRPAKRARSLPQYQDITAHDTSSNPDDYTDRFEKALLTELTCEICFMLFYQPVTTPCQHTFCAKCLQRSLDHRQNCPLCRQWLPDYAYFQDYPCNKVVLSVLLKAFPVIYAERGRAIEQEERDARLDTPIFVCALSFPGVPTVLHFFEPRYRLMLRRCLESPTPRFGMIMPPSDQMTSTNQGFGTMLQIRSVQMLPDGRSMVHTLGISRFRILEKGSLDGYMVGRIEAIEDLAEDPDITISDELDIGQVLQQYSEPTTSSVSTTGSSSSVASSSSQPSSSTAQIPLSPSIAQLSNEALMAKCIVFVEELRDGAAPWVVQKMNESIGPMPTNPATFSFWMALALPIDDQEKAKLLPIRSPRLRLRLVVYWIDQLRGHWWFTSGCIVS